MKKRYYLLLMLVVSSFACLQAQQDPHYSQYMFNGLLINPAYAGRFDFLSVDLLARWQWVGLKGAPQTYNLNAHLPTANLRHGFGISVFNDQIGISNTFTAKLSYAYKIPIGKTGNLSLGLNGAISHYRANIGELNAADADDVTIGQDISNVLLPNTGAGIYYHAEKWFAGFSVPRLIPNEYSPIKGNDFDSRQQIHFLLTGGYIFTLSKQLKLKPSFLLKTALNAPTNVDINLHFLFKDWLWFGASYRTEDAIVAMMEVRIKKLFRIGYAYDFNYSRLRTSNTGSHELMLGFDFNVVKEGFESPRYF